MTKIEKKRREQKRKVFEAFRNETMTMFTAHKRTGVLRSTICGYVAEWKRYNQITEVKKGLCPYTGHRAGFYSADPELLESRKTPNNPYYNRG